MRSTTRGRIPCGPTVESLDRVVGFDEALARCAEAAAALPSVDLAVARVEIDDVPRVATRRRRAGRAEPGRGDRYQTTATRYYYAPQPAGVAPPSPCRRGRGRRLGTLTVYARSGAPPVPGDELDALQAISRRSAAALAVARRPVVAPPPPRRAEHGGLGDRELFHETLALLAARARREGSVLTVLVLDIDDFRLVNGRIGPSAGDLVIAEIADALRELIRPTDLGCRTGGDEFAVALPDSAGSRPRACTHACRLACPKARRGRRTVHVSAGIAELDPDDDGVSLFERATAGLRRAKDANGI